MKMSKEDINERGRIYLPGVHELELINNQNKKKLENSIDLEFSDALKGIKKLPIKVKLGVYSAYLYYYMLFRKIKRLDVEQLLTARVRISNFYKLYLLFKSYFQVRLLKTT